MANYISEKAIQQRAVQMLCDDLGYDEHLNCQPFQGQDWQWSAQEDLLKRSSPQEVISRVHLKQALENLNNHLPSSHKDALIAEAIDELARNRSMLTPLAANKEIHHLLKRGFHTFIENGQGHKEPITLLYIDFRRPGLNHFMVVEELPIIVKESCRTDLLLYVNGVPLVFIELKNNDKDVKLAYDNNLHRYREHIAPLFHFNAFVLLSNGDTTKAGSFDADWEHYSEWKRVEHETEAPQEVGLETALHGMCDKTRLLDIVENFIFYIHEQAKIVAKNHQYLGVNNGIASFEQRLSLQGKLGVFWHTQGSGKSFSMIFFAMKVIRKYTGDYTFVVVTDRESLDDQIFKNFLKAEVINEKDEAKATSRAHLKTMLRGNKRFIFTLIQKFGTAQGEEFPQLTNRRDIIVLVDEAHRSQYNTYAANMRKAMPYANYLAFTGTPLLDANETTRQWFGNYVSEYNFAQSMEDGATVPLFYEKRVPQVQLSSKYLNDELADIVASDNLSEAQEERLKQQYTRELEVIKSDDRLNTIAQDIVKHFPYRKYAGKGMVISVDKYTAVKMYHKVQQFWKAELRLLNQALETELDATTRTEKQQVRNFMKKTEMYVVVSKAGDEDVRFQQQGLDIRPHRENMNKRYGEQKLTLKDRFQRADDSFRLVFLCAKWLTGFDSPTISTLYLDKPMQNHTLMQTIARANRVAPGKASGMIVDYFGVFENLEKALEKYGRKHHKQLREGDRPVREKAALRKLLVQAIEAARQFLAAQGCDMQGVLCNTDVFAKIGLFKDFANRLSQNDDLHKTYQVHENAIRNLYNATQPDAGISAEFQRTQEAYTYLRKIIFKEAEVGDYAHAWQATRELLDESIGAQAIGQNHLAAEYSMRHGAEIDLRTIDFEKVAQNFQKIEHQYLAITDLREFLRKQLQRMVLTNTTRINFAERLQEIIHRHNAKSTDAQRFFEELKAYAEALQEEDRRASKEQLSEEELQIFDLLYKEHITHQQKQVLKLAAQGLLKKLKEKREEILVTDWQKTEQQRIRVERFIKGQLYEQLMQVYAQSDNDGTTGEAVFHAQSMKVYEFIKNQPDGGHRFIAQA